MRRLLVKILQILDGTPAEDGKPQRGQSVVEMALITPLLIVLFASMVEVGWFANNYLSLLDVTRAGARRGTTLQDSLSPLQWDNRASHVPDTLLVSPGDAFFRMGDVDDDGDGDPDMDLYRRNYRSCPTLQGYIGFYNELACLMIRSMDPLSFNNTDRGTFGDPDWRQAADDIVISAFAIESVPTSEIGDPPDDTLAADVRQAVVVGRYPTNANECEVDENGYAVEVRDPFDFNGNELWDVYPMTAGLEGVSDYNEAVELVGVGNINENPDYQEVPGFDVQSGDVDLLEQHVGFVWFGNHRSRAFDTNLATTGRGCIGSEWTIEDVERVMNLPNFLGTQPASEQAAQREMIPSQGVILVEVFWEHRPLLNLPFFEPIWSIFSDRTVVHVWALFPLPTVEPFIQFPEP